VNVYGSGEAFIVDSDQRSDFSFQTHIRIYKLGGIIFDCVCVLFGICCSHVVSMVLFYVLYQVIAVCSIPNHIKSCKCIKCLNKENRDENEGIKRIKIKMGVNLI